MLLDIARFTGSVGGDRVAKDFSNGWLFKSRICPGTHITLRAADLLIIGAVEEANLAHKGFSTHSTWCTFITRLWETGVDLHTIQLLTGHKDIKSIMLLARL